jgi:tetratricopeptide (TPR) repeat protein
VEQKRWREIEAVFEAAQERTPDEQAAFLDHACGGDADLRQEVESLLRAATNTRFLEPPFSTPVDQATSPSARASSGLLERLQRGLRSTYHVERELGGGGMARIFVATDPTLGRQVVLKVLAPDLAAGLDAERFHREVRLAASLQHPHVVPLHAAGEVDGLLYYTMPFVAGESLRHRLDREGPLPLSEVVRLLREVTDALGFAHRRGIIHRDLKPANILLEEGHALVADFGIAKALVAATGGTPTEATHATETTGTTGSITSTGLVLGTPVYMAPEQAANDQSMDHRADLYALGCLAYELLTGRPPFQASSVRGLITAHLIEAPTPVTVHRSEVPPVLASLVMALLAKDPDQRPQTAQEVLAALETGEHAITRPAWTTSRRRILAFAAGTIILVTVAVVAAVLRRHGTPARALDPNVVAVAPFRVTSADPTLGYLREGMIDLLAAKLTGQGGPRATDPRSVLSAWRRSTGSEGNDLPQDAALELAQRLGAGQLLLGTVVGSPGRIVLNATVYRVPGGQTRAETSVQGPLDSLPALVDQLAAKLLTLGAGEGEQRLSSVTSTSLPALRSYLDGQAMYRRGRYGDAETRFHQALQLDSTFVLAALGLLAAGTRTGAFEAISRGRDLVWAGRDRLNPRDYAYMMALMGRAYTDEYTYSQMLAAAKGFVDLAPDRVEAWTAFGDILLYFGEQLGIPAAHPRAASAFGRALELDPAFIPALENLLIVSARSGDTATVRRLGRPYLEADSVGGTAGPPEYVRWRVAVALNDSGAMRRLRARFATMPIDNLNAVGQLSQYDGVALDDGQRAYAELQRRESRDQYRAGMLQEVAALELNRGRPSQALRARQGHHNALTELHRVAEAAVSAQIEDALYWDGDSSAAAKAAGALTATTDKLPAGSARRRLFSCTLGQWRLARGQLGTIRGTIAELRSPHLSREPDPGLVALSQGISQGCALLLDAELAAAEKRADASVYLERLDSIMRTGPSYRCCNQSWNLVVARLREAQGDRHGALAATRRRLYLYAEPQFLSSYLRQEGRLAALTGDREGAIRAYQHYLALRSDPEPALRPQVEQVRDDLAALLREPGR